jgi:hypothetical protein
MSFSTRYSSFCNFNACVHHWYHFGAISAGHMRGVWNLSLWSSAGSLGAQQFILRLAQEQI